MTRLKKNTGLTAAIVKIILYVVIMSATENFIGNGISQKWRGLPAALFLAVLLILAAKKNEFSEIGLTSETPLDIRKLLYLIPMAIVATANLWNGAALRYTAGETVWYVFAVVCIGFIEEILFRGYLLHIIMKKSVKRAIIISSLTFGLGHIVNLINGAEPLPTLLQLAYAVAIGFMLSVFAAKTKQLLPCCIFHGIFNSLAAFSNETGITVKFQIFECIFICALTTGYAWYMWKCLKQ